MQVGLSQHWVRLGTPSRPLVVALFLPRALCRVGLGLPTTTPCILEHIAPCIMQHWVRSSPPLSCACCSTGYWVGVCHHYSPCTLQHWSEVRTSPPLPAAMFGLPTRQWAGEDGWSKLAATFPLNFSNTVFAPQLFLKLFFSTFSTQSSVFAPQWACKDGWSKLAATFPLNCFNTFPLNFSNTTAFAPQFPCNLCFLFSLLIGQWVVWF